MDVTFRASAGPSLGVEWELALVDADGRPANRVGDVLKRCAPEDVDPLGPRVVGEFLQHTVELTSGVCRTVGEATADLARGLQTVREAADELGLGLLTAGTHPLARWEDSEVSIGPRYATLLDRTQWWGRQMTIFGLHVHVGARSGDRSIALLNALLAYHPHLQALSGSSPYWAGVDTGYCSNRALLFQQLPTAGLPFQFADWAEFERYLDDVVVTGVVDDVSELRWDLRPSPRLGTLEARVCDAPPTLLEVAALTALTHCLVVHLDERLDAGLPVPHLAPWHVQENKWRAARYGLDAIIVLDAGSGGRAGGPVRERVVTDEVTDLLDVLEPVARRLGCADELRLVETILAAGSSDQRQRAVAARADGDLRAVVRHLQDELRAGRPLPAG